MRSRTRLRTALSLSVRTVLVAAVLLPLVGVLFVAGVLAGLLLGLVFVGLLGHVVDLSLPSVVALLVAGVAIALYGGASAVRAEIRGGRERLLARTTPVDDDGTTDLRDPGGDYEWYVRTIGRLARQADVPAPAARVHLSSASLAYTVVDGERPTVIVSDGLLDALPRREAEAVLAHEIAHVANRDLRWMTRAMVPLLGAEEFYETFVDEDDSDPRQIPYRLFGALLLGWGRFGAGLFLTGREFAADRGAARSTGDPGALASALARLDEASTAAPSTDLRAVDALNVLPTARPRGRLRRTHPPTEVRIERLRALEREYERR